MIFVIGIDHKSAPLEVRETLYQRRSEIMHFWKKRFPRDGSVLSTCNRIEIYGECADEEELIYYVNVFCQTFGGASVRVYERSGLRCVLEHALALACGLKSQLLGETQIMDQLRHWKESSALPVMLQSLWDITLSEAKRIRFKAGLDSVMPTIAGVVFEDIRAKKVLRAGDELFVIGSGAVAELIAREFAGFVPVHFVARKNRVRARYLAGITDGQVYDLSELRDIFAKSKIIISATSSPHSIVTEENVAAVLRVRARPLYIYDLSVPRDVESMIGAHACVHLQDLDDLGPAIEINNRTRTEHGERAAVLIEEFINNNSDELFEALS